jgi:phage recombination protein Bet
MSNLVMSQATSLAKSLSIDSTNAQELVTVLKATAFKGQVSDAQMAALLIVAQQYGLNPWTKEIYAFPDKNNGIVPVVGVDGWSRIINSGKLHLHHLSQGSCAPGSRN